MHGKLYIQVFKCKVLYTFCTVVQISHDKIKFNLNVKHNKTHDKFTERLQLPPKC